MALVSCAFAWRGLAERKKGLVVGSRGQDSRGWGGQEIRAAGLRCRGTEERL